VLACRDQEHHSLDSYFVVNSLTEKLVDPVGAGDALLAYATLAMLACGNAAAAEGYEPAPEHVGETMVRPPASDGETQGRL
jgi:sugar/nucleoside kinase (ribokinase family)